MQKVLGINTKGREMNSFKFKLYPKNPRSAARPRVMYYTVPSPPAKKGKRAQITADGVPLLRLATLIKQIEKCENVKERAALMVRRLGYKSGEYSDDMFLHLVMQKIKEMKQCAKAEHRQKIVGGIRRLRQVRNDSTPSNRVFMALASAKDRLLRELSNLEDWDAYTRAAVLKTVNDFEKTLAGVRQKLSL